MVKLKIKSNMFMDKREVTSIREVTFTLPPSEVIIIEGFKEIDNPYSYYFLLHSFQFVFLSRLLYVLRGT